MRSPLLPAWRSPQIAWRLAAVAILLACTPVHAMASVGARLGVATVSGEVPRGAGIDLVAQRAFLRTEPGGGAEVVDVTEGDRVYLHAEIVVEGTGQPLTVAAEAFLSGTSFCGGSVTADPGTSVIWCEEPWVASPGERLLRWDLDPDDIIREADESNNSAFSLITIGRSSTPEPSRPSTATRTPTGSPGRLPTPTPTTAPSSFPDFHARGDADCSVDLTAADVVAHLLGVRESVCGNDDCDRDGVVDGDDAACGARCLFGDCALLAGAPEVMAVVPDSAENAVALSLVRIHGSGLASEDGFPRVRVGEREAGVVEATADEIVVALPALDPGPADLVVFDGEAASRRFPLRIAESLPGTDVDGLSDLLDVLDSALQTFANLDLGLLYVEENIPLVMRLTAELRAEIELFERDGLDALPEEIRGVLDGLVGGAGVTDAMRDLLATAPGARGNGAGGGGPAAAAEATRRVVTRIYAATVEITREYSAARIARLERAARLASLGRLAALAARYASAGAAWLAAIRTVADLPDQGLRPLPLGFRFLDRGLEEHDFPTAGGFMHIRGCRVGPSTTGLEVTLQNGVTLPLEATGRCGERQGLDACPSNPLPPLENGCAVYRLPDSVGFCGVVQFRIFNDVGPRVEGTAFRAPVQPEILDARIVLPVEANGILLDVRGVATCRPTLFLDGPDPLDIRWETTPDPNVFQSPSAPDPQVLGMARARKDVRFGCPTAEVPPGRYRPTIEVAEVANREEESPLLEIESRVNRLQVECDDPVLSLSSPDRFPQFTECAFRPAAVIEGRLVERSCFPITTERVVGMIDDTGTADFANNQGEATFTLRSITMEGEREKLAASTFGLAPGTVTLTGTAFLESGDPLAGTDTGFTLEVRDLAAPTISSVSPCSGTVEPEDGLSLTVDAFDNFLMSRLIVTVPPGVSPDGRQEFPCALDLSADDCPPPFSCDRCVHEFDIAFNEGLEAGPLIVEIEAVDGRGESTTEQCAFEIAGSDRTPPTFDVDPCGGVVAPGQTLRISVEAGDETEMDRVTVSLPDGIAATRTQTVPCSPGSPSCAADFDIELAPSLPSSFTARVAAFDAGGNETARECTYRLEGVPDVTIERCGGVVQPGSLILLSVMASDDRSLERLVASVASALSDEPVQEADCFGGRSCNRTLEISLRDPLPGSEVEVLVEAIDEEGKTFQRVCAYSIVRPAPVSVRSVLEVGTPIPGREATFRSFDSPRLRNGRIVFTGTFQKGTDRVAGIYVWDGGDIVPLVDDRTIVPGTGGERRFRLTNHRFVFDGENLIFTNNLGGDGPFRIRIGDDPVTGVQMAFSSFPEGASLSALRGGFLTGRLEPEGSDGSQIYLAPLSNVEGDLEVIAGPADPDPVDVGRLSLDVGPSGPAVAFRGSDGEIQSGIYVARRGGAIERIVDENTEVPEGRFDGVSFDSFSFCSPALDGDDVAFRGDEKGAEPDNGVYIRRDGKLFKIADPRTAVPGGEGLFEDLSCSVGADQGTVIFRSSDPRGVYAYVDGALTPLIVAGDELPAGTVRSATVEGDEAIEGRQVVIQAQTTGDSTVSNVYLVTIGVP